MDVYVLTTRYGEEMFVPLVFENYIDAKFEMDEEYQKIKADNQAGIGIHFTSDTIANIETKSDVFEWKITKCRIKRGV